MAISMYGEAFKDEMALQLTHLSSMKDTLLAPKPHRSFQPLPYQMESE